MSSYTTTYPAQKYYPIPPPVQPSIENTPQPIIATPTAPPTSREKPSTASKNMFWLPIIVGGGVIGLIAVGISQKEKISAFFSKKTTTEQILNPSTLEQTVEKTIIPTPVPIPQPKLPEHEPTPHPPQGNLSPVTTGGSNPKQPPKKKLPLLATAIIGTSGAVLAGLSQLTSQTAKLTETFKPPTTSEAPMAQTVRTIKTAENTCLKSIEAIKTRKTQPLKARTSDIRMAWFRSMNEKTEEAVCAKIKAFQAMGFNGVLLETINGGTPYFYSKTFDAKKIEYKPSTDSFGRPAGTDALKWWIDIAHKINETEKAKALANPTYKPLPPFEIHAWANIFYGTFKELPQWANKTETSMIKKQKPTEIITSKAEEGKDFLDPANPEVRAFIRSYLKEIEIRHPDGINLDYIRYPSATPEEQWGFTRSALQQFKALNNAQTPLENPRLQEEWEAFKTKQVDALVQDIAEDLTPYRSKGGLLSAAIFPNQPKALENKNQHWSKWAKAKWTDCLFPMNYAKNPVQFKANVREVKLASSCTVPVNYVRYQTKPEDYDDTQGRYIDQVKLSKEAGSTGVSLFGVDLMKPRLEQALQQQEQTRKEQEKQK